MKQVVYACSKPEHIDCLYRSAESIREHLTDAKVSVYASREVHHQLDHDWIDSLHLIEPRYARRPRFESMQYAVDSPTLFLDCDTLAVASLDSMFDVLRDYDIAMCPAVNILSKVGLELGIYEHLPPVSEAVGEWNGGVILAKVNQRFRSLVGQWKAYYGLCRDHGYDRDQAALRSVVSKSKLRVATLRNNYNFRTMAQQSVNGPVKILHGKGDLTKIAAAINESTGHRLYTPTAETVREAAHGG